MEILDGNYDEIRAWILHGQVDCGFLSSIVAEPLRFYPLWDDPLCVVLPENHPLAELFRYPLIIGTPGCGNDIQHLLKKCPAQPRIAYSLRDDPLIMALAPPSAAAAAGQCPAQPGQVSQAGGKVGHGGSRRGAVGAQAGKGSLPG